MRISKTILHKQIELINSLGILDSDLIIEYNSNNRTYQITANKGRKLLYNRCTAKECFKFFEALLNYNSNANTIKRINN